MAQRRSRNCRKSSINASGILDQDTNVYNDDDPLWYNKSIVRPSTSLSVTRNASSLLNPDSNLNESQITERWFNNLSKSESTKLIEENARKNHAVNQEEDEDDSSHSNPTTESESEHESKKRRARFGMIQKKSNKSDKSNVFLKALEQTTDSHTRNLTRVQIHEENESHLTRDESRTIRKMLPNTYKNQKQGTEETTDNFDELFNSDSASEKIQMNACSSTPTLKRKNNTNIDSIDDVARKLRKKQTEKIEKVKQSTKKNRPTVIEDTVLSTSITEKYPKRRAPLFSQENKSKTENFFDAALNSSTETIKLLSHERNDKIPFDENKADDANRSESSSIPKNIRRTKSISTFPTRQSQNRNSINNKNGPESPEEESDDNVNEILTNHHATQESKNKLNNTSKLMNKSKANSALNDSSLSSKSINKSVTNSINGTLTKSKRQEISRNNIQNESDGDTSTMPKYIRRTKSRLFFTKNSLEKNNDENEILDVVTPAEQDEINLHGSSVEKTKKSLNKSMSLLRDQMIKNQSMQVQVTVERIPEKIISHKEKTNENHSKTGIIVNNSMNESRSKNVKSKKTPRNSESIETPQESNEKNSISQSNLKKVEKSLINGRDRSREKSVETSSDGVSDVAQNQDKINHHKTLSPQKSMIRPNVSDDLIQTPNPGQSTLNPHGKPLTRITEFFSFGNNVINEDDSGSSVFTPPSKSVTPPSPTKPSEEKDEDKMEENDEREDEDVNVTHDSDVSENPLISRKLDDIPPDSEKSTHNDELAGLLNISRHSKRKSRIEDYMIVSDDEAKWAEIKKKTDAIKAKIGERMKREEKIRQDREREKLLIEKKFQLAMRKAEAEKKKKQRKPIDKAYYVDGKIYKQPKLPRPKQWVTDRLYKYLWRCMEPKFGHRTRVKSEEFIVELSDIVTVISRRKKYDNYKSDLDKLLITMAKLNIIVTRYDFYRFCSDFMPYSFRIKVVPMQLPGNERNIPYDPDSVFKPILKAKKLRTPQVEESNHESESETNNEDQNESNNDSDSKSESETSEN